MKRILESLHDHINSIPKTDSRSKIGPVDFVAALLCSVSKDRGERSIAAIRRQVISLTGKSLSRGSFWERMATNRLNNFLCFLIGLFCCSLTKASGVSKDILKKLGVRGVFLLDSSSITLPQAAQNNFPAPRNNVAPAAIKWHALFNLFGGQLQWFDLTEATTHDRKGFPPLDLIPANALLIFDLGYWDYLLLQELTKKGVLLFISCENQCQNSNPRSRQWHLKKMCR